MRQEQELWWFIIACGMETVAIGVGVMIPSYLGWVILAIGLVIITVASIRISQIRTHLKKVLRDMASFMLEGDPIREKCINDQKGAVPEEEALAWADKVKNYLINTMGGIYGQVFMTSDDLGRAKIPPMFSAEHQRIALFVSYRLMRIDQFLAELRQK